MCADKKLLYELKIMQEMGRPRNSVKDLVSGFQDTIQEHVWKIYAYGESNPRYVTGWHISIEKHIKRFRLYNKKKRSTGTNLDRNYLEDKLIVELFELGDIETLDVNFSSDYSRLDPPPNTRDVIRLRTIMLKIINIMLGRDSISIRVEFR